MGLAHLGLANPISVISLPNLGMMHSGNIAMFIWPVGYSGFVLETSGRLVAGHRGWWCPIRRSRLAINTCCHST